MKKIKAGIIGATGYAGCELVRLLYNHPFAEIAAISSVSFEGQEISAIYANLKKICDQKLADEDAVIAASDVVFASLPHGLSEKIARKCVDANVKLIDLGADFRLSDECEFKEWYGLEYQDKALHARAAYCVPELHRAALKGKEIVANPGCYPTSIALGLAPLVKNAMIDTDTLIIDSKSGVTGAGRNLTQKSHFPECNESFSPYKVADHRHTPEIEEVLGALAGKKVTVTFVPHLLPVNRGIVSTMYAKTSAKSAKEIITLYENFYRDEPFVRVLGLGDTANLRNVRCSNYCDISVHYDSRTSRAVIVSAIDNMVKGAAGQAIQNMNLLFGIAETAGLTDVPPAF